MSFSEPRSIEFLDKVHGINVILTCGRIRHSPPLSRRVASRILPRAQSRRTGGIAQVTAYYRAITSHMSALILMRVTGCRQLTGGRDPLDILQTKRYAGQLH